MNEKVTLVLASKSPARLTTLRNAGVDPTVMVSDVDEDAVAAALPQDAPAEVLVCALAEAKSRAVAEVLARQLGEDDADPTERYLVLGCDSMLQINGRMVGKPYTPEVAVERIREMRGTDATLWTGHSLAVVDGEGGWRVSETLTEAASTVVHFGDITDDEISAYVGTGEPLNVAGSFTIDGLGGPFVTGVTGDPHSVVGVSLPLLRKLVIQAGTFWPDLWQRPS